MCFRLRTFYNFFDPSHTLVPFVDTSLPKYRPGLVCETHDAALNAKVSGTLSSNFHRMYGRAIYKGSDTVSNHRVWGEEALKFRLSGKHHPNTLLRQLKWVLLYHTSHALLVLRTEARMSTPRLSDLHRLSGA